MRRRPAALAVVVTVLLAPAVAGCAQSRSAPQSTAQVLWSSRTPYVGDNSRVAALVRHVGPAPEGTYSLSLQTRQRPYALEIELHSVDKPLADTDVSRPATLLLGLIANLDAVSVRTGSRSSTVTAADASRDLGHDVKDLGRSQQQLADYLDAEAD